jgi:hypothetical protein
MGSAVAVTGSVGIVRLNGGGRPLGATTTSLTAAIVATLAAAATTAVAQMSLQAQRHPRAWNCRVSGCHLCEPIVELLVDVSR